MGRKIAVAIIIVSALYLMLFSGIPDMIATFLLIGVVPYTDIRLSPTQMLVFVLVCSGLLLIRYLIIPALVRCDVIKIFVKTDKKPNFQPGYQRISLV